MSAARNAVSYPGGLPQRLIARMIAGGMRTRVYYTSLGGFDTHARQKNPQANLLSTLATGIDSAGGWPRTGARGTDHGPAGPMFLVSPGLKGGLHGAPPDLANLVDQDPRYSIDFRSVYATVLEDWLDTPAGPVLGSGFPKLAFA